MAEKIRNDINGWLVIDKPYGMGSTEAVTQIKRLCHPMKIGHGGTLDPLATGVLPIALGKATRTVDYVMNGTKTYEFKVKFGIQTSTDDVEGAQVAVCDKIPTPEQIKATLSAFVGDIKQTPPAYSALKIGGKRACDLARSGKKVEMKSRIIHIEKLELLQMTAPDEALFRVVCGKGTYVRSLGRDIALQAGSVGHITYLRRTHNGAFDIKDSFSLEQIEKMWYKSELQEHLFKIETVLSDILELAVDEKQAHLLGLGQALCGGDFSSLQQGGVYKALLNGELVAFVRVDGAFVQPTKVFKQI